MPRCSAVKLITACLLMACCLLPGKNQIAIASSSVQAEFAPSKQTVYVNEIFNLTLTVRIAGVSIHKNMELMELPAGEILKVDKFQELPVERSLHGNTVVEIRRSRCTARALRPGRIDPAPKLRVLVRTRRFPGSLLFPDEEAFQAYDVPVTFNTVEVLELPADGKPPIFSGAVGNFSLDASVSPTNIAPGSLVTIVSRVSGNGYLENISAPCFPRGPHFKTYDPRIVTSNQHEILFEQHVIPQSSDIQTVPELSFCFFDPALAKYVTLTAGPFPITFVEVSNAVHTVTGYTPSTAGTSALSSTKSPPRLQERRPLSSRSWAIGGMAALAVLVVSSITGRFTRKSSHSTCYVTRHISRSAGIIALICVVLSIRASRVEKAMATLVRSEEALFAPRLGAEKLFSIHDGAWITVAERHEGWVRICWKGKSGWIPADAISTERCASK